MNALHLIAGTCDRADPSPCDPALVRCAAGIRDDAHAGVHHAVWLIGGSELERRAARFGVHTTDRIAPPMQNTRLAARPFLHALHDRGTPDVIICYTRDASDLAVRTAPFVPRVDCFGTFVHAVEPAQIRATPHESRRTLELDTNEPAVLLIDEPASSARVKDFVLMLGLLAVAGVRTTGVVRAGGRELGRAQRYWRTAGGDNRQGLRLTDAPLPDILPACAAAVCLSASSTADDALWDATAHAAGVPVVSTTARGEMHAHSVAAPEVARVLLNMLSDHAALGAALRSQQNSAVRTFAADLAERCRRAAGGTAVRT